MQYQCDIDIRDLISLEDVMKPVKSEGEDEEGDPGGLGLGPNGAMLYCMEFLEQNVDWLVGQILEKDCSYFLIDMPGQVELYTNHQSVSNVISRLYEKVGLQCCAAHLVDASYLMDVHKYLSACTLSMTAQISLSDKAIPIINLISKIDLLGKLGRPQMNLIDLENLSGISYLYWDPYGDEEDDQGSS
mmetsp:Transcript_2175/g.3800  ORF Transcript_2175/g.3800 Transcript_2175/m.3800 type:complete len:188 (+) Transcript_2175:205-768(+)